MLLAALLFAVTAALGAFLATGYLRDREPPRAATWAHGLAAVSAFAALVVAMAGVAAMPAATLLYAFALAVLVGVFGIILVTAHLAGAPMSAGSVLAHGAGGLAVLVLVVLSLPR